MGLEELFIFVFIIFLLFYLFQVSLVKNQGNFGVKLPNGTLTGALGNLQKRKSDIAMTAFFMKVEASLQQGLRNEELLEPFFSCCCSVINFVNLSNRITIPEWLSSHIRCTRTNFAWW